MQTKTRWRCRQDQPFHNQTEDLASRQTELFKHSCRPPRNMMPTVATPQRTMASTTTTRLLTMTSTAPFHIQLITTVISVPANLAAKLVTM